jgi:hypothetical protein
MTTSTDVLERVSKEAGTRGITPAAAFVDALPPADDRGVLLLVAADADAELLRAWIGEQDPQATIATAALESAGLDSAITLAANRVAVVLRCGALLMPEVVEAAAAVASRPAGTFVVVLSGAEVIRTAEELDLIRRGLWRVLLGTPGEEWAGQDLALRGCLLWSAAPPTDGSAMAKAVGGDVELLRHWVVTPPVEGAGPDDPAGALAARRAGHAVDLLERGLARAADPTTPSPSHRRTTTRRLRETAADLRTRLLRRIDADRSALELQLTASLQMLENELLDGLGSRIVRGSEVLQGQALERAVRSYVDDRTLAWRRDAVELAGRRLRQTAAEADDLVDGVD